MAELKLDDLVEFMCDTNGSSIRYCNHRNLLGDEVKDVTRYERWFDERDNGKHEFFITFKNPIKFDKLKDDIHTSFIEDEKRLYIRHMYDALKLIMVVEKEDVQGIRFYENEKRQALGIIHDYLRKIKE